ncbi:fimbria/pilus outer membrane usher protein [Henriciella sp.]|uniref:fimbria/pilus outer membrane usher protein n=1 Tax=Henriciella sp. TaxID=1968823 RepID=UPI00261AFE3D|nr:fimbria/pilus outer membrane usher protein [Henriciella sp.]
MAGASRTPFRQSAVRRSHPYAPRKPGSLGRWLLTTSFLVYNLGPIAPTATAAPEAPGTNDSDRSQKVSKDANIDEIYAAMFGRTSQAEVALPYPVIISGLNQGDVVMTRSLKRGETLIDTEGFLPLLMPFLIEEKQSELQAFAEGKDQISTGELTSFGIPAQFDHTVLILIIDVPLEIRSVVPIALQPRRDPSIGLKIAEQATTSAIVNVAAGTSYVHDSEFLEKGLYASETNVEAVVNHDGFVLETGIRYNDIANESLVRNDTRLTKDFVDRMVRVQAGDIHAPSTGLQGNPKLLGIAGFRNFGLKPYEEFRTNPSQQFELQRPASVSIYINGQFQREIRLSPGRYSLTDLPLQSAAGNDVVLEIEYDSGETDRVIFSAFYDFNLLKKGVTDFALSIGPTSDIVGGEREYDFDNVAISGFYRKGWTDQLTAGVSLQADSDVTNIGGEGFYTNRLGTFGVLAHYSSADGESGTAITGQYQWSGTDSDRNARFDLLASYADEQYKALGRGQANFKYDLAARGSANLSDNLRLQLFAGWTERYGRAETTSTSLGASLNWRTRYGTLGANVRHEDRGDETELSAGINFTLRLDKGFAQFGHDTRDSATRASYTNRRERGVGSLGWRAGYQRQSGIDEIEGELSYTGNRFEGRIQQSVAGSELNSSFGSENITDVSLGTALVFADGHFALSRPVYDSFAIFAANKEAGDFELAADPQGSIFTTDRKYAAHSSMFGPAVVPDLNAYYVRTIEIDAPDAPAGVSLGGQAIHFKPSYRGGYVVELGDDRNVAITSVLVDTTGTPVEYAAGYAINEDGERKPIFTNAGGRLYVDGLKHGEHIRIEFDSPAGMIARFTVPEGDVGILRLETPIQLLPENPTGPGQVAANQDRWETADATL